MGKYRWLLLVPNAELISQIFAINELIKCPEMFTNCAEHVVCVCVREFLSIYLPLLYFDI